MDNLTVEHVMPQTLSEWWEKYLGSDAELTHEMWLHTIGNLTLTAYNSDLSNKSYSQKQQYFEQSHLELNKYFSKIANWKKEDIEQRASRLAERAMTIWPYFGNESTTSDGESKAYTTPLSVYCLGKYSSVNSWRDVFVFTLETSRQFYPEAFDKFAQANPIG